MDELSPTPSFDDDQRSLEDLLKDPDFSKIDPDDLLNSSLFDDSGDPIDSILEKLDTIPSISNIGFDVEPIELSKINLPTVSPSSYRDPTIEYDEDEEPIEPIEYNPNSDMYEPDPLPPKPIEIDSHGFPLHGEFEGRNRAYSTDLERIRDQSGYSPRRISHGNIGRNGPPIHSNNTSMEMDHVNNNFHRIQINNVEMNTAPQNCSHHTPSRKAPERHHSDPMTPSPTGDVAAYNEAMEKLCESMKRSAMSRNLVKQLSGRNLVKQPSARSLTKQGSQRSLMNKQGSARNLMRKQGSNRSLVSDHSGHRSSSGYFPARRSSIDTKHRIGREVLQSRPMPGRGSLMRHLSQSALICVVE